MGSEWQTVKLKDIVNFNTGKLNSNAANDGGLYPFFTCSPETLRINVHAFDCEAVLLAGNNANGVFPVKYYKGKFNAYQRTYVITPKANVQLDVKWLFFQIQFVTNVLQKLSVGTATKFLTKQILDSFEVRLPPIEHQRKISNHLWALLEKENLNRQINQTLEQMAQTLFKSWFVDFDPVMDNALDAGNPIPDELQHRAEARKAVRESEDFKPLPDDVRQLFPDAFEESELGWVPKGWGVTRLENILELAYGKALTKTDRVDGKYPVYGSGGVNGTHKTYLVKGPGIIVGRKGTVGSLHWERNHFFPIDTVFYVKPHIGYSLTYCFYLLKTLGLETMNTDAAVPGLNRNNAYRLKCVIPSEEVREHLTKTLTNGRKKMDACLENIETLSKLRDELLPKLISGDIKIGDSF
ncbi:restriction endonuclease subunit S [Vibrio vulnificus]|uniref:restriction endonuclease subunit S n=1 Tax=Vibrio vulnificus TaxID=672 RepID=UPI00356B4322